MLAHQRSCNTSTIKWVSPDSHIRGEVAVLECWTYDDNYSITQGDNFRFETLIDGTETHTDLESALNEPVRQWIRPEDPYSPPVETSRARGGIRLILCERQYLSPTISMTREAFETVETGFNLHPSTIPSFLIASGCYAHYVEKCPKTNKPKRIKIVVKFSQKHRVANYCLSLCYDVSSRWTTAWICGDGVLRERPSDRTEGYGFQKTQVLDAIRSSPFLWDNPLFLPIVLLQNYTNRVIPYRNKTDLALKSLEGDLGVTHVGGIKHTDPSDTVQDWPQNVKPGELISKLHSIQTENFFMSTCCGWLQRYTKFLQTVEAKFQNETALSHLRPGSTELADTMNYLTSIIDSLFHSFESYTQRGTLQINVLYTAINQQENILNHQANEINHLIAISNKQDSISMSTFTFITALFLPATFIATLFGTDMFDWGQANEKTNGSGGNHVSNKFWVFWAVAAPLTVAVMISWFIRYRCAVSRLGRRLPWVSKSSSRSSMV